MHILIVDDEPPIRHLLSRVLGAAGHATREAGNTEEALASMEAEPAGVALCDVQMPGEHDGIWLTNEVRRKYHATAVVLVTGVHDVPPATSMRAGVIAYITKPFTSESVLHAVKQAITWHQETAAAGPSAGANDALDDWFSKLDQY
jgi:DNA-binding NtrC family response regulator